MEHQLWEADDNDTIIVISDTISVAITITLKHKLTITV